MSDDPLSELLRSPLVEQEEESSGRWRRTQSAPPPDRDAPSTPPWIPFVAALAVGGLVVVAAALLTGNDTDPSSELTATTTTAASTSTTQSVSPGTPPVASMPNGYVEINGRIGVRTERVLHRFDELFVSFTTVVRSGLDGETTAGFAGGRWELVLDDGTTIDAADEIFDPLVPAAFTLVFPFEERQVEDLVAVRIVGEALRTGTTHETSIDVDGLPWTGVPGTNRIPLDDGLTFVIGELDLNLEGGTLRWELDGPDEYRAAVTAEIQIFEGGTFPVASMSEARPTTFFSFFGAAIGSASRSRSGELTMFPSRLSSGTTVSKLDIFWVIDWVVYLPADATIPLTGVRTVQIP